MTKIMLVIDNPSDLDFLEKILQRMSFTVIAMKKGDDLSVQLIDHFPDIVFASTLGKNEKTLAALSKIKEARGKPKLVFVRQENESQPLNSLQKKVIDGVLYSPVDPFKLIDLLSHLTGREIQELRQSYNSMLSKNTKGSKENFENKDKKRSLESIWVEDTSEKSKDYGVTTVFGDKSKRPDTVVAKENETSDFGSTTVLSHKSKAHTLNNDKDNEDSGSTNHHGTSTDQRLGSINLISDPTRKKKYDQICKDLSKNPNQPKAIDGQELRELQSQQSREVQESQSIKNDRKQFIKTLFSMKPSDVKKKA